MDMAMNMNIDTLLEAAVFLEQRSQGSSPAKTREDAVDFHPYAKAAPPGFDGRNGSDGEGGSNSMSPTDEASKERRRAGGAGTREVHNKLEKNRRAHLKECFEMLKKQIPSLDDKRTSNLSILRSSLRYIQMLKRKEKEFEQEMQRLAREKISAQERIVALKRELAALNIDIDLNNIVPNTVDNDTASTSTATADNESPIVSDVEEEEEMEMDQRTPKPHVPVTATLPPAIQPPVVASGNKQLAVNANTPIVLAPSTMPHAMLAMPTARALSKVITAAVNHPVVAVSSAGSNTVNIGNGVVAGNNVTTVTSSMSTAVSTGPMMTTPTVLKTPVNQILQQTITQRVLAQHLQHQAKLQQVQNHNGTPQVITVQANSLRPVTQAMKPMAQLRQAVTMNHVVPSLLTPGTSILATPASLATSQAGATIAVGSKIVTTNPSPALVSIAGVSSPVTTTGALTTSVTTPVTYTAMKQFFTTPMTQIPAHLVSPAGTHMSAIGHLMSQAVARNSTLPPTTTAATTSVPGPVTQSYMSPNLSQMTQLSAAHPVMSSLAHVTPVTQIGISPMTMMSPTVQVSPNLSQAQLVGSPMIRSLGQIPIQLQQPFGIGQIVKPVVMVSMSSVVTTSAPTATVQMSVPVTHSS